ncbi:MAG: phosphoribosylaminoimidazolesuccinocarboxamide synthase [Ignavibacteria bacterium RIFOXYB2_FULL_35_12]|nr:MAG: phosphoribosylaminoimidazolesuccinocarboxamide synthase [Ignavibacteria bacterium GWA2_36_19]OGU52516.1 MAG: phosphoribosylaminoimidazolesuccinocarboxamide synthase [Ignavibacteria bacterium GWC2_35_8]OGU56595.1 MAG: phosphoribosylaminoimidazolesuccinocarboxamide synthase [Ignavibacteria bacterium GWF2_35_20]OGU81371.1 MAG: phosphoribosylaminoimidazolesuccinocarboxamide synthase [Ignavibacteria bacterium RIFOXYA2_FULL_35_9]OGU87735.1 MAG: phosphoribosylaminoimidazolesuccinocarboxamide s
MDQEIILSTNFPNLKLFKRGKVRDVYSVGDFYLIVSTDRLSAFDVIMAQGIPFKGKVLTKISEFWFDFIKHIIPNHLISTNVDEFPAQCRQYETILRGRSMLVKKAEVVPIECIVRGYICGSGWNDYMQTKSISGIKLHEGLVNSEKLDEPIFTPSTKAEIGLHDENISFDQAEKIVGNETITKLKNISLEVYKSASEFALSKGIIIADTKMEFGFHNGELILVDEVLTPDSSRFWPADHYQKGRNQESYDKQIIRDYLLSINFNKQPPPPILPDDVIQKTSRKYLEVLEKLTGEKLA